jgi:biotin-(acetyl-CoA carboxylase) ligase
MFEGDFKEYILKKIQNNKLELFYFDYIEQYIENNNDTDFKEIFNKYKESKTISISNINFSNIEKEVTMSDDIYYTMKMEINIKNYPIQETLNIQNIEL